MKPSDSLEGIRTWVLPEEGSLPEARALWERVETMVEPAILDGAFGDSRTLAVSGMQYHLGGAEDTRQLAELAGITEADRVLDVCCFLGGPALQLAETRGCHVVGIDINPVAIAAARRIAALAGMDHLLRYEECDASAMPFDSASFSVIWNQGSLNHDAAWLREFDRLLAPGGRLALVFEFRPAAGTPRTDDGRWTLGETIDRVSAMGYALEHIEDLTEREIVLGWERLLRRLEARRDVYVRARSEDWVEEARREFQEEIAAMRRREWSNGRLIAVKPA